MKGFRYPLIPQAAIPLSRHSKPRPFPCNKSDHGQNLSSWSQSLNIVRSAFIRIRFQICEFVKKGHDILSLIALKPSAPKPRYGNERKRTRLGESNSIGDDHISP